MRIKLAAWFLSFSFLQVAFSTEGYTQTDTTGIRWSVRMAESAIRDGSYMGVSSYIIATAMKGFRNLWQATGEERYIQYIRDAVDADLADYYAQPGLDYHDIDPVNGGSLVLCMYTRTGEAKYQSAADSLMKYLQSFPRTSDGGFYHKDSPHMQVDDLYMGSPFLSEYGRVFDREDMYEDAVRQAVLMEKHCRDSVTGLYYHVWYEKAEGKFGAGNNPVFWGRGMGWVAMALVDILDFLPEEHSGRDTVIAVFRRLAESVAQVQDDSTGVWWQVLDRGGLEGNFMESSASCMFVYALAKGMRLGYIDGSYREVVYKGYQGILESFIRENPDTTITVTGVCSGQSPDISLDGYIPRGTCENGHALGPFIMASVEIELQGLPPSGLRAKAVSGTEVQLSWTDNAGDEEGFRIERSGGGEFAEIALVPADTQVYMDTSLVPLTAYTYRVRSYKGDTNSIYSNHARAITMAGNGAPAYASQPEPGNGSFLTELPPELSWLPGAGATSHDVYFGTTDPPPFVINQAESIFAPDTLQHNTTYYWQVNEVNDSGTTAGAVWSFTTLSARGMVAHWKMDETTGSVLHDDSGNGNDGELFNMSEDARIPGISGGALRFDGIDDYIVVPHDPSLDFGDRDFTISFWLKQTVMDRPVTYILKGTHGSPGSGKRYEVHLRMSSHIWPESLPDGWDPLKDPGYQLSFTIDDNLAEPVEMWIMSGRILDTAEWVHIAAKRLRENEMLQLHVNSDIFGLASDNMGDISQDEDLYIGVAPDIEYSNFEGALDDIRLYNYALSNDEIEGLYQQMITGSGEPLMAIDPYPDLKNYPNPFRAKTTIVYSIDRSCKIRLAVYNLYGQEIAVLSDQVRSRGTHTIEFNASGLPAGTYVCRLQTDSGRVATRLFCLE